MASKMIILVALLAVAVATDVKKDDKSIGEAKKGKRGLFDLGYGSIDSGLSSSYYSTYPEISAYSTVITKEVLPHPVVVEKHVAVPVKVPYAVPVDRPYPVVFHTFGGLKTSSW